MNLNEIDFFEDKPTPKPIDKPILSKPIQRVSKPRKNELDITLTESNMIREFNRPCINKPEKRKLKPIDLYHIFRDNLTQEVHDLLVKLYNEEKLKKDNNGFYYIP